MLFEYSLDALRIMVIAAVLVMPAACDDNKSSAQGESGSTERHENPLTLSEAEAGRAGLKVEPVEQAEWALTVAFGTVAPDRDRIAKLVPPAAGRVTEVRAALGDRVQRGAMLATGYTQAQAELAVARASLERTQRRVAYGSLARKEAERARADYDKAQAAATAAAAKLANLRGHTAGSGGTAAALAVAAPFDGVVIEKSAVFGEYAQSYQAMFTIADLSSVWIEVDISSTV
jgi:cobalt-zinc-cadmium efflux system membrane fusion protein